MARHSLTRSSSPVADPSLRQRNSDDDHDTTEKLQEAQCVESVVTRHEQGAYISPEEIQGRFALLRDLSQEQMAELNKRVVRKIDWRMMPIVSLMYLMK